MADKKISELNTASAVYDADDFALVQDGETKQVNASTVKAYAKDGLSKSDVGLGNVDNTSDATKNSAVATLTNKTISGSSNTLSNIANASLTNSSITINGNAVSLGGSTTVSAATTNTLTISTGLSGTSFDGSAATTIAIDSSVVTLTGTQTLTNKTLTSPAINGGTANNVAIGGTTPAAGAFTTLSSTGNTTLGDASGDTLTINAGTTTFAQGTANGVLYLNGSKVATSGSALTFDGANLLVGSISNPGNRNLSVNGIISLQDGTNERSFWYWDGTNTQLVASGATALTFWTNNNERLRIDSSGNVGIGTSSPQAYSGFTVLTLDGATNGGVLSIRKGGTVLGNISLTGNNMTIDAVGASASIAFRTGSYSITRAIIDTSGNLGLGVTPSVWSTGKAIEVNAVGTSLWGGFGNTYLNANYYYNAGDKFAGTGRALQYLQVPSTGAHIWNTSTISGTVGNPITFTQHMTLTSKGLLVGYTDDGSLSGTGNAIFSGNVGIGTSSPLAKLHVEVPGSGVQLRLIASGSAVLRSRYLDATAGFALESNNSTETAYAPFTLTGSTVRFNTGTGANAAIIDSPGNLGLGVTPSAWNTKGFEIGYAGSALSSGAANDVNLSANAYSASSGWARPNTGVAATRYNQNGGSHYWQIAASGSNPIAWTHAMTLDASGNLLVGVTGASARLSVASASGQAGLWAISSTTGQDCYSFNCSATSASVYGIGLYSSASSANTAYLFRGYHSTSTLCFAIAGNGNVTNTNNSYGGISDQNLKENIADATPKLVDLLKVKIRNFNFIGNETKQIGVVAQELEEIFPSMVEENGDGVKSVKYSVFTPMLIKSIQELHAEIEQLKMRIN